MSLSWQTRVTDLLARIDEEIVVAYEIGNDGSLKMRDLFKLNEMLDGLKLARDRAEALLNDPMADDYAP